IRLKIEVFRPIPSARVRTAMTVNPGDLRSCRNAKRNSFMIAVSLKSSSSFGSHRDNWIDTRGTTRWHTAGDQSDDDQRNYGCDYRSNINCAHVVKQRHQRAASGNRTDQSDANADCNEYHALAEHELKDICALRAERHADAEFASALCHGECHHTVKTHA